MLAAELNHGRGAHDAEASLHRARLVIDAGVNHAAVVSALVAGNAVFLFQHQQLEMRQAARDFEGDAESDNSTADDDQVVARIDHE